jgi:hypothetical protein
MSFVRFIPAQRRFLDFSQQTVEADDGNRLNI